MFFIRKNFSQFFSVRPGRRRAGYSIPAEVQTLPSKVLLSAVPAEVEDPATEDPATEEVPTIEATEDPTTEDPNTEEDEPTTDTDDTTSDDTQVPGYIESVSVEVVNGTVTITGQVVVPDGSSPTLTFGGVLSGLSATIDSDGIFTLTASSSSSGTGTINLVDDDGNITDFETVVL